MKVLLFTFKFEKGQFKTLKEVDVFSSFKVNTPNFKNNQKTTKMKDDFCRQWSGVFQCFVDFVKEINVNLYKKACLATLTTNYSSIFHHIHDSNSGVSDIMALSIRITVEKCPLSSKILVSLAGSGVRNKLMHVIDKHFVKTFNQFYCSKFYFSKSYGTCFQGLGN